MAIMLEINNLVFPTIDPGTTLTTAYDLGVFNGNVTVVDAVNLVDSIDTYQFTLTQSGNISIGLGDLIADADLELYNAEGTLIDFSNNFDTLVESIEVDLAPGNYFISVVSFDESFTSYELALTSQDSVDSPDAGNTPITALELGLISANENITVDGGIGDSDLIDFFSFSVGQSGVFTANLSNLSADADIKLIDDLNRNGIIDQGEIIAWQWERDTSTESIRAFLDAGDYILQVESIDQLSTEYDIDTTFTNATIDPLAFDIEIDIAEDLNLDATVVTAVNEAANFWENVITHSSSSTNHVLRISVEGDILDFGTIASAGPIIQRGQLLPTSGQSIINIDPRNLDNLRSDPDYFARVMIHEFSHVLGLGILWDDNELINPVTATYNPNTYAGIAYGELLGTSLPTAVPLTTGEGQGSDLGHWDEATFGTEIATSRIFLGEIPSLSPLTIASLRDLGWNVNFGAAEPYTLPNNILEPIA